MPSLRQASPSPSKGSRIPTDWQPSFEGWNFAVELLGAERAKLEAAKFVDYWLARAGAGGVKHDWAATWRTWCRKAAEGVRELPLLRSINGGGNGPNRPSAISSAADRLIAQAEDREREAGAFTIDGEFTRVAGS